MDQVLTSFLRSDSNRVRTWPSLNFRLEVIVRVFADAMMVNAALLLSLMLHYLWVVSPSGP